MLYHERGSSLKNAAIVSEMSEESARKYLRTERFPSEMKPDRNWRTREDPFASVQEEIYHLLETNEGLEARTILTYLQEKYPDQFSEKQLRTLRRRIRDWRAIKGPDKEIFFAQEHDPGDFSQSDFTNMNSLGITINGVPFPHLVYHFVLTYSNWESISICLSESFESLISGFQKAIWELGKAPVRHQTDSLSAAVNNLVIPKEFTADYQGLLSHYGIKGQKINLGHPNENGDVEKSNHLFKKAVEQSLMLRGSSDFDSHEDYEKYLNNLVWKRNQKRRSALMEELAVMKELPELKLNSEKRISVKVSRGSTIKIQKNTYSVPSRLIGSNLEARLKPNRIDLYLGQKKVLSLKRLTGKGKTLIDYRHVIPSLVRKPMAFVHYKNRKDLFPSTLFQVAYEHLGDRDYVYLLFFSFQNGEVLTTNSIKSLLARGEALSLKKIKEESGKTLPSVTDVKVESVPLSIYDGLLGD